jgi:hypothetical protein
MSDITPNVPDQSRERPANYSGAIIVRFGADLAAAAHASTAAPDPRLARLRSMLGELGLPEMRPLVRRARSRRCAA